MWVIRNRGRRNENSDVGSSMVNICKTHPFLQEYSRPINRLTLRNISSYSIEQFIRFPNISARLFFFLNCTILKRFDISKDS